jgi:hypothetical protein
MMKKLFGILAVATFVVGIAPAASAGTIYWTIDAPVPSVPPTLKLCVLTACDVSHGFVFVSGTFAVDSSNPLNVTGFNFIAQGGTGQMAANFAAPYTFSDGIAGDHYGWFAGNTQLVFFGAPGFADPLLDLIFPAPLAAGNSGPVNLVVGVLSGTDICNTSFVCAFVATADARIVSSDVSAGQLSSTAVPEPATFGLLAIGLAGLAGRKLRRR